LTYRLRHKGAGFTLIEIIITMMIVSILGTMIYTYFGGPPVDKDEKVILHAFSESVTPIIRLRASAALHKVIANITADYNRYPRWRSGTFYSSSPPTTYVIPTNFNGYYYRLTTGGTSSGPGSEPVWPLSSIDGPNGNGTVNDNGIIWTWVGRLRAGTSSSKSLAALKSQIGDKDSVQNTNLYGKNPDGVTYTKYTVVENRFIQFDASGNEIDDATGVNNILKVTLKNETGETLTSLFFDEGL
jgi:prepilin-type N-terminal cleavage/methylation domain-containing protein